MPKSPKGVRASVKIAKKAVDGLSGLLECRSKLLQSAFSTSKPNLEGDVLDRDPKTKFLSLSPKGLAGNLQIHART
jgi:hypothetical protein